MTVSKARWKRLLAYMLAFAMVFSSAAFSSFGTSTVQAAGRSVKSARVQLKVNSKDVTKKTITLGRGCKVNLDTKVIPKSAKKKVTYKSAKTSVATVNSKNGVITGKKKGVARIDVTVTGKDNKKVKTWVKVKVVNVSLKLNKTNASVNVGKAIALKATVTPKDSAVKWTTSNKRVATVGPKGVVKGVKAGTATITAQAGTTKKTCKVTVKAPTSTVAVTSVQVAQSSLELTVGNAGNIVANVLPANATDKTLEYTSSDENIVTVLNKNEGAVIGTGVGTAVITVRSANGKEAKVQVTVKYVNTESVTVSPSELPLEIGQSQTLTLQRLPENASAPQQISWNSSDSAIASVDAGGNVTGIAKGSATISATVYNPDGSSAIGTCTVVVKKSDVVTDGIASMSLLEPYAKDTILYGKDMVIRVQVKRGGQPASNAKVTLKMKKMADNQNPMASSCYEIKNDYETADSEGYVDFIIGLNKDGMKAATKAFETGAIPEVYKLIATDLSSGKEKEIIVNTATLNIGGIDVVSGANRNDIHTTKSLDDKKDQEYVVSQKVSHTGSTDSRVMFKPDVKISYGLNETAARDDWNPPISSGASEKYTVYNDTSNEKTTTQILDVPRGLKYITLKFNKISLSDYTKILVGLYKVDPNGKLNPAWLTTKEITNVNNTSSGYSIQLDSDEVNAVTEGCRLVVSVITKGQVSQSETGYELASVEGKWGIEATSGVISPKPIEEDIVKWDIVEDVDYEQITLDEANVKACGIPYQNGYEYTCSVPVFPHTGDAFIRAIDTNKNVTDVYAYPTKNVKNKNVLATTLNGSSNNWTRGAILVTEDEATQKATNPSGELFTESGNYAIVNAERTGRTNLRATINIDGLGEDEFNEQNGSVLYTSVQWAPVDSAASNDDVEKPEYYSLEGQVVTVIAQLLDANGNRKAVKGKNITFAKSDGPLSGTTTGTMIDNTGSKKVVLASDVGQTDPNGQVALKLLGDGLSRVKGLKATCDGYKVKLYIQTKKELKAIDDGSDIYWVDLGVRFVDSAVDAKAHTATNFADVVANTKDDETGVSLNSVTEVGQKWYVGYQTIANVSGNNAVKGIEAGNIPLDYTISSNVISVNGTDGKPVRFEINDSNRKSYLTDTSNNVASLESNRTIDMYLTGKINATLINDRDIVFDVTKKDGSTKPYDNVGMGVSQKLNGTGLKHKIEWKPSGLKVGIQPDKYSLSEGVSTNVTFKVDDNYGNLIPGVSVNYKITTPSDVLVGDAKTEADGTVSVEIPANKATGVGTCFIVVTGAFEDKNITATDMIQYTEPQAQAGIMDIQSENEVVEEEPAAGIDIPDVQLSPNEEIIEPVNLEITD